MTDSSEQDNEQLLRQKVRTSLESILGDATDAGAEADPSGISRAQQILDEETERYYEKSGLVKHLSRTGRGHWVTQEEKARLDGREKQRKRKHRSRRYEKIKPSTILVWVGTAVFAAVLLAYLFATQTIG